MKKLLGLALLMGLTVSTANIALADGMVFDPVEYQAPPQTLPIENTKAAVLTSVDKASDNYQNALFQLDSAQVEIRNNLLEYKSKYSDVDAQYKLVKEERAALNKQIKTIEKRIKDIDKTKERIKKYGE